MEQTASIKPHHMSEKQLALIYEDKFRSRWRPAIGWAYIAIVLFDFIIGPSLLIWVSVLNETDPVLWTSLTLSNGGIFHAAIGAILGVTAWTRGQEKVKRIEHNIHDGYEEQIPGAYEGFKKNRY